MRLIPRNVVWRIHCHSLSVILDHQTWSKRDSSVTWPTFVRRRYNPSDCLDVYTHPHAIKFQRGTRVMSSCLISIFAASCRTWPAICMLKVFDHIQKDTSVDLTHVATVSTWWLFVILYLQIVPLLWQFESGYLINPVASLWQLPTNHSSGAKMLDINERMKGLLRFMYIQYVYIFNVYDHQILTRTVSWLVS